MKMANHLHKERVLNANLTDRQPLVKQLYQFKKLEKCNSNTESLLIRKTTLSLFYHTDQQLSNPDKEILASVVIDVKFIRYI